MKVFFITLLALAVFVLFAFLVGNLAGLLIAAACIVALLLTLLICQHDRLTRLEEKLDKLLAEQQKVN